MIELVVADVEDMVKDALRLYGKRNLNTVRSIDVVDLLLDLLNTCALTHATPLPPAGPSLPPPR